MKKIIYILAFNILVCSEYTDRYYKSMNRGIEMFESSQTESEFLKASNLFYRISQVMKTDWLSSYYYAFCNTEISMLQDDSDIKEQYLDKALDILAPFDTLDVETLDSLALSEIHTLRAMIYVAKIFINPMVNGMKYGPLSGKSIKKSQSFYPSNPRPYYLDGQAKFYTPSAFGGGVDKALPLLENALKYYNDFEARKYWPDWGQDDCQILYDKAQDEIQKKK
tara:strand:- start:250 stop:918 length:669 start_codon:yes stop_codon:yes gene_type:complete